MQGPFLLCLCQRGAFTGSQTISFSLFLWAVSGKPCLTARSINGTSRHARQANREEWFYPSDRTRSDRHIKSYFLAGGLPGSTLPAMSLFLFGVFPFSRISLLKFSCLICLHFRLPPFSRLSVTPHQAVISVLGAKVIPGLDGNARSSLLFSEKISSPSGSISPKNLAFPNPYLFKHPKRKRPMRPKDA